jgi:endonuclease/exonuclease/phosphatase family metal-dependent hydrolase
LPTRNYIPPENDHLTTGFEDLIPAKYKGSDSFLDLVNWNIRYFHDKDPARVKNIVHVLNGLNADVLVLQEIKEGSLDVVAEELAKSGAGHYTVEYGTTGGDQRIAIMYDLDWIRAKDAIEELFGKGTIIAGDGKDAFPRLPLYAYLTSLSVGGEPFDFQLTGLHLKSQRGGGESQRRMAAERLATWLTREAPLVDADILMVGDWNEPPNSNTWSPVHHLENEGLALFSRINDSDSISHLYYKNMESIGSRLDIALVATAAATEIAQNPDVVRWTSLDKLLAGNPKAKEIKQYIKEISAALSDHLPMVTRYYFEEQE